jgi:hypothetical protein
MKIRNAFDSLVAIVLVLVLFLVLAKAPAPAPAPDPDLAPGTVIKGYITYSEGWCDPKGMCLVIYEINPKHSFVYRGREILKGECVEVTVGQVSLYRDKTGTGIINLISPEKVKFLPEDSCAPSQEVVGYGLGGN